MGHGLPRPRRPGQGRAPGARRPERSPGGCPPPSAPQGSGGGGGRRKPGCQWRHGRPIPRSGGRGPNRPGLRQLGGAEPGPLR